MKEFLFFFFFLFLLFAAVVLVTFVAVIVLVKKERFHGFLESSIDCSFYIYDVIIQSNLCIMTTWGTKFLRSL